MVKKTDKSTPRIKSKIFVSYSGFKELTHLMASANIPFYKSGKKGVEKGPRGLISSNDVVILKNNCQWGHRGGTNTDLIREVIQKILDHPDSFNGEIVVADNGHKKGSFTWPENNAVDRSQTTQKVVDSFSSHHKVSTYLWDNITSTKVSEYDEGDLNDGYVLDTDPVPGMGWHISYPKFKTAFGAFISLRHGIWDSDRKKYGKSQMKLINMPVLKSHSGFGVTACVKHYVGVQSQALSDGHSYIKNGAMGSLIVGTIFPVLNILDCIWVNANPKESGKAGPNTPYDSASNTNVVLTSTDPVALDYWASKNILIPAAKAKGYKETASIDPDHSNPVTGLTESFHNYLERSMEKLAKAGYKVTMNEAEMLIHSTEK